MLYNKEVRISRSVLRLQAKPAFRKNNPSPKILRSSRMGRGEGLPVDRVCFHWPGLGTRSSSPAQVCDLCPGAGADWNLSTKSEKRLTFNCVHPVIPVHHFHLNMMSKSS